MCCAVKDLNALTYTTLRRAEHISFYLVVHIHSFALGQYKTPHQVLNFSSPSPLSEPIKELTYFNQNLTLQFLPIQQS